MILRMIFKLFKIVFVILIFSIFLVCGIVLFDSSNEKSPDIDYIAEKKLDNNKWNISYRWKFVKDNLKKQKTEINIELLNDELAKSINTIELSYEKCYSNNDFWSCFYKSVYSANLNYDKIFNVFEQYSKKENLSERDKMLMIISFVQNIKYERPMEFFDGIIKETDYLPPKNVVKEQIGDCDSKSLLMLILLRKMNIDCVLFESDKYEHVMVGINVSSMGKYKTYNGKKYYFLESTYPGWLIGDISPDWSNLKFWRIINI